MMEVFPIIPHPVKIRRVGAETALSSTWALVATEQFQSEAEYAAAFLRQVTGFPWPMVASQEPGQGVLRLVFSSRSGSSVPGKEGYRLLTQPNDILIEAETGAGVVHGLQSLLQLLPPAIYGTGPRNDVAWSLPLVEVEDAPRFGWRGAMLDCSRHFFPKTFIKRFIDLLALHKLNVFHWHLTDDQGWRIEIKRYPRLTEVGAWRAESPMGNPGGRAFPGDGIPHGGFYTQDDIREIVQYAATRHVTIVPEIEMPGHAQAAISAYPELGCRDRQPGVFAQWGISETIYNPFESTLEFLTHVLEEVFDLFPGEFIHVGGDEAVKTQWKSDPDVQRRLKDLGLKDEDALQSDFIRRINEFCVSHGRRLIGWDEIMEGGLAPGAAVMCWRGVEHGAEAARTGHDVVMAPCSHTYFDYYQTTDTGHEPMAIGGYLPLETVYSFEPLIDQIPADRHQHVLGVQGQHWTEYMPTGPVVEYRAFPRLCALSEVAWSPPRKPYENFLIRLTPHLKRLDVLGVRHAPVESAQFS